MKIRGISREALLFILESARKKHPKEFAGLMEADRTGLIVNIHVLPGTTEDEVSAHIPTHMMPLGVRVAGSVHSHPTEEFEPSDEDLHLFSQQGDRHIIAGWPYREETWGCYDADGSPVDLAVLDEAPGPLEPRWEEELKSLKAKAGKKKR
jgi:proteasome lid subunit RPN8/RPN11